MAKKLLLSLHLIIFSMTVFAQTDPKEAARQLVEIADEVYFVQKAPDLAREQYVQAAQLDPDNVKANWMAGQLYLETIQRGRSAQYFERVLELDPNYRFDLKYRIGQGYQLSLEFEKALEFYEAYKQQLNEDKNYRGQDKVQLKEVERRIEECQNGLEFTANPAHYSIKNVGSNINSPERDYAPVLNEDETIMVFTSRRREGNLNENVDNDNVPYEDIFISRKNGGTWGKAENIGEVVNTLFHDSNLALSADGRQLYIYSDENNGDIYVSELSADGTYSTPQPLSENINSTYKEGSISVTADGEKAYYSSNRPGGFGGMDIYVSVKDENGQWSKSRNLGPAINTEYDEDGPFIDFDGGTIYFSSQGRKGMGGFDIFRSDFDEETGEWSEPINLGFPINTPDDDIYFVVSKDRRRGYYASVREDGLGYTDIYMVELSDVEGEFGVELTASRKTTPVEETEEEPKDQTEQVKQVEVKPKAELKPVTLAIRILASDTRDLIDAKVSLKSVGDNIIVPVQKGETGFYTFTITSDESKEYALSVEKNGYVFQNLRITIPGMMVEPQQIRRTITMKKVEKGVTKVLRNLYFDFDKATFKDESYEELNKLENFLAQNPGAMIEIAGHTDAIGSAAYNKDLSLRRAQAVVNYLTSKGVPRTRLKAVGYGEEKPLASNDDELEGRELNRRVEFTVLN